MRCENCGADLGNESCCPTCDGGVLTAPQSPTDMARSLANAGWWCVLLSLIAIFVLATLFACPGTIPALELGALLIAVGLVSSVFAEILAIRRRDLGVGVKAFVCFLALLGCSVAGALSYMLFPHSPYALRRSPSRSINNIKQLAIAVQTYSQDYNETFPGWVRNPDGRYAHNVWDEQIEPQVKWKGIYSNGDAGIRSYSQTGMHDREVAYGLNGLLITPPKATFDGNADFTAVSAASAPSPLSPGVLGNPSGTILFAELSTKAPMPVQYGSPPDPKPYTWTQGDSSPEWQKALDGWTDISPRDFVEVFHGPQANPYREPYGKNVDSGIARDLHGGGGVYAFCDGHAKFMKIGTSVGIGTIVDGKPITAENCWSPENTNNMWIPRWNPSVKTGGSYKRPTKGRTSY